MIDEMCELHQLDEERRYTMAAQMLWLLLRSDHVGSNQAFRDHLASRVGTATGGDWRVPVIVVSHFVDAYRLIIKPRSTTAYKFDALTSSFQMANRHRLYISELCAEFGTWLGRFWLYSLDKYSYRMRAKRALCTILKAYPFAGSVRWSEFVDDMESVLVRYVQIRPTMASKGYPFDVVVNTMLDEYHRLLFDIRDHRQPLRGELVWR